MTDFLSTCLELNQDLEAIRKSAITMLELTDLSRDLTPHEQHIRNYAADILRLCEKHL